MHTIVSGFDGSFNPLKKLEGRKVQSFEETLTLLNPGETVTVELGSGTYKGYYKQVGVDADGGGWIQRRHATEY